MYTTGMVVLCMSSAYLSNSLVQFYPNGNKVLSLTPRSIQYIISQGDQMVFVV